MRAINNGRLNLKYSQSDQHAVLVDVPNETSVPLNTVLSDTFGMRPTEFFICFSEYFMQMWFRILLSLHFNSHLNVELWKIWIILFFFSFIRRVCYPGLIHSNKLIDVMKTLFSHFLICLLAPLAVLVPSKGLHACVTFTKELITLPHVYIRYHACIVERVHSPLESFREQCFIGCQPKP